MYTFNLKLKDGGKKSFLLTEQHAHQKASAIQKGIAFIEFQENQSDKHIYTGIRTSNIEEYTYFDTGIQTEADLSNTKEMSTLSLGQRIRMMMVIHKVGRVKSLSKKTGISETYLSQILNDKIFNVGDETIRKIEEALPGVLMFHPKDL